jgi:IclR family transcriptional regulator, acetate operon repressor
MSALERGLAVLELLAAHPEGMAVGTIAAALDLPPSGTHRLLNQLVDYGFVHQDGTKGDYALSMKLAALGLAYLGQSGVTEVAQPILDRLAAISRELVRLSVVDGGNLVWVAVAQGATSGLRYDPGREQGVTAHLATSSSGLAWLATLTDDAALMKVAAQGFRQDTSGPAAFPGPAAFLAALAATRARGYSITIDTFMPGMAAMAAPVVPPGGGPALGAISIAGPSVRFTEARMAELAGPLREATADMAQAARASAFFRRAERSAPDSTSRRAG